VYSTFSGSKLVNRGVIFDGSGFAVDLVGQKNVTVVNKASGTIVGGGVGVLVGNIGGAENATVINDGSIIGLTDFGVESVSVSNFDLTNTGHIFGPKIGVVMQVSTSGAEGPMVDNSGVIGGGTIGISTSTPSGVKTTIVNESGGTIEGSKYAIATDDLGKLLLKNHGTLKGYVASGNERDKIELRSRHRPAVSLELHLQGADWYRHFVGQ
jgi:hypothetical protein